MIPTAGPFVLCATAAVVVVLVVDVVSDFVVPVPVPVDADIHIVVPANFRFPKGYARIDTRR